MTRTATWGLLAVVAAAAAILSFSSLTALAVVCGFTPALAPLLPVVVDAGAAAGALAWLGGSGTAVSGDATDPGLPRTLGGVSDQLAQPTGAGHRAGRAARFARALTLVLLASSVAGNATVHYLQAYRLAPAWWLVVAVSAVAPAVLGAVVHLAVVTARAGTGRPDIDVDGPNHPAVGEATPAVSPAVGGVGEIDRVAELVAAGAGRRRVARELGVSEHAARRLLAEHNGTHAVTRGG